jgi:hypothetical protein
MRLHIVFKKPGDPTAKPSPQRSVVLTLPERSRVSGAAVAACTASDAELQSLGPSACPDDSRIGTGTVTLTTGGGPAFDPFIDDVVIFNAGKEWAELFTKQGTGIRTAVGRRKITNPNTLSEAAPPTPGGPPDFETAVNDLKFRLDARTGPKGPLITTPPTCPATGHWTSTLTFTTADGGKYTVSSATPCHPAPVPPNVEPRSLTVALPRLARRQRARISIRIDGKFRRTLRGPLSRLKVSLTGLGCGRHSLVIVIRAPHRHVQRVRRMFRTACHDHRA